MKIIKINDSLSNALLLSSVGLIFIMLAIGPKLPYLQTEFSFRLRMYYLCPLIICYLLYRGFIYKKHGHKLASFPKYFQSLKSWVEKVKTVFMAVAGLALFVPCSFMTIGFTACLTWLFARSPFVHSYKIQSIRGWGGPVWTHMNDLHLRDQTESGEVVLPLTQPTYKEFSWKVGDTICLHGRTWIFGTIIDSETRDLTGC